MDLEFTDEQEALRTSVRDVLTRECPVSVPRALTERGEYPDALWKRMVNLDWPVLSLAEDAGGVGYGFVEMAVVAEELGRALAPSPFEAVATQYQPLLCALGEPVVSGATGTVAVAESGSGPWLPARCTTTATRRDAVWHIDGVKHWVFDGADVDELLVVARVDDDGALGVFAVSPDAAGLTITRVHSLDATRRLASVALDAVAARPVGEPGASATADAVDRVLGDATAVIALETVGTCDALFTMALEYAKVREQFGVPIGSFQAIKHKLADMFVVLERARVAAYFAALAIAEHDERRDAAVSMAKAAAGDAQRLIAQEAIQIHGGIGYTWEHDVHLFVKRAKGGDALFGTAAAHRARIADLVATGRFSL